MTKDQLWKDYEYEKMIKERLADELSWLRDKTIPELRAEIKRKDEAIEQAIDDIDDRQYGAARWTLCKVTEEGK